MPGFRCNWFENATPVCHPPECYPRANDLLVIPEVDSWGLSRQTSGIAKVIFNQNAYQTFEGFMPELQNEPAPYQRPDVLATIVVSEDSRSYLRHAFPGHPVFRVRYSIDPAVFRFQETKRRQIAYMPRKAAADAKQVLEILRCRGSLKDVSVVEIDGKSESETAAILRESLIFLSFATEEGWSLPPMEAMACGCITIGYDGRGGREYFTAEHGFPINRDDIVHFAATLERILTEHAQDPAPLVRMAHAASNFILSTYTPANEQLDILRAWEQITELLP